MVLALATAACYAGESAVDGDDATTVAAATAVAGTLFLAGCAGPDPAQLVEPVAPQRPPSMVADTGSCGDSATLGYRLCASQAQSKADRINALSDREYEQAQAAYEAAQKRYNAAVADAKKNPLERFMDRLGRAGFIGIGIIIAAVVCARLWCEGMSWL